jgi:hypothetical protein
MNGLLFVFAALLSSSIMVAAQDVLLLTTCHHGAPAAQAFSYSQIEWYATEARSNTGVPPGGDSTSAFASGAKWDGINDYNWEGVNSATFADGNVVTVDITNSNAAVESDAGTAHNNYHSFTCLRDYDREVWRTTDIENGQVAGVSRCVSNYWCK